MKKVGIQYWVASLLPHSFLDSSECICLKVSFCNYQTEFLSILFSWYNYSIFGWNAFLIRQFFRWLYFKHSNVDERRMKLVAVGIRFHPSKPLFINLRVFRVFCRKSAADVSLCIPLPPSFTHLSLLSSQQIRRQFPCSASFYAS